MRSPVSAVVSGLLVLLSATWKEHKTTKYNQMLYINLLSATVSLATLLARRLETELCAVCRDVS